jgi:integral membrane sensor domain MASE1
MTIDTRAPSTEEQTAHTTRVVLLITGIIGALELLFAAAIAVTTASELSGMTEQQRADSWTELGYVFAVFIAAPPALAALLGAPAWVLRHRSVGTGLAIAALCVVSLEALFFARAIIPGL